MQASQLRSLSWQASPTSTLGLLLYPILAHFQQLRCTLPNHNDVRQDAGACMTSQLSTFHLIICALLFVWSGAMFSSHQYLRPFLCYTVEVDQRETKHLKADPFCSAKWQQRKMQKGMYKTLRTLWGWKQGHLLGGGDHADGPVTGHN